MHEKEADAHQSGTLKKKRRMSVISKKVSAHVFGLEVPGHGSPTLRTGAEQETQPRRPTGECFVTFF